MPAACWAHLVHPQSLTPTVCLASEQLDQQTELRWDFHRIWATRPCPCWDEPMAPRLTRRQLEKCHCSTFLSGVCVIEEDLNSKPHPPGCHATRICWSFVPPSNLSRVNGPSALHTTRQLRQTRHMIGHDGNVSSTAAHGSAFHGCILCLSLQLDDLGTQPGDLGLHVLTSYRCDWLN